MNYLKSRLGCFLVQFGICGLIGFAAPAGAAEPPLSANFTELAERVVKTSAGIKPGEVVIISGGKHTVPLMEELSIQVAKAGGHAAMWLESERVQRSFWTEVSPEFQEQPKNYLGQWLKQADVLIQLPDALNPRAIAEGIPSERVNKVVMASQQPLFEVFTNSHLRGLNLSYPTPEAAARRHLDFPTYEKMFWDSIKTDYGEISAVGEKLKRLLQAAKTVRITTPSGTDLTLSPGGRPVIVDGGTVPRERIDLKVFSTRFISLPGGSLEFAPLEDSAEGRVVVTRDRCKSQPLLGLTLDFKGGRVQSHHAAEGGECFDKQLAKAGEPGRTIGSVSIGLNPAVPVMDDRDYRPQFAAGLVMLATGPNDHLGGKNPTKGGFGFAVPIVNATVTIDGTTVIQDGKLKL